ncbi:MAG: adenine deaminase, partial [Gammaproteobacteria bacterium]|nr:adenine deaminase [Gammaproteobacteria bacterium]
MGRGTGYGVAVKRAAGWGIGVLLLGLLAGCDEPATSAGGSASEPAAAATAVAGKVPLMTPDAPFEFDEETRARQNLTLVALGKAPADLIISGATVLNVFTLSWMEDYDIVIAGERIAWVGPRGEWGGEVAETVDASGRFAVPGFGEAHKHIESSHLTPEFEAEMVLPQGTTWIAEGSHEFANVNSEHNAEFWLKAWNAGSPLKIYPALGSATPPTAYESGGGYYGYEEVRRIIESDRRVIGLDEVMDWPAVWNPESP